MRLTGAMGSTQMETQIINANHVHKTFNVQRERQLLVSQDSGVKREICTAENANGVKIVMTADLVDVQTARMTNIGMSQTFSAKSVMAEIFVTVKTNTLARTG